MPKLSHRPTRRSWRRTLSRFALAGALGAAWTTAPRPAAACGNITYPTLDRYVADIKKAARALERGWPTRAAALVLRHFPSIRTSSVNQLANFQTAFDRRPPFSHLLRNAPKDPKARKAARRAEFRRRHRAKVRLARRAKVVMALAALRTDGSPGKRRPWRGSRKARDANLRWAIGVLTAPPAARPQRVEARSPGAPPPAARQPGAPPPAARPPSPRTPQQRAWRAEALARVTGSQDEARRELLDLHARKLLGEPMAYAALAALQRARGERKASRAALARCKALAARASQCRVYLRKAPLPAARSRAGKR